MSPDTASAVAGDILLITGPQTFYVHSGSSALLFALRDRNVEAIEIANPAEVRVVTAILVLDCEVVDKEDLKSWLTVRSEALLLANGSFDAREDFAGEALARGWTRHPRCRRSVQVTSLVPGAEGADLASPTETSALAYDLLANFVRDGDMVLLVGAPPLASEVLLANSLAREVRTSTVKAVAPPSAAMAARPYEAGIVILDLTQRSSLKHWPAVVRAIWPAVVPGGRICIMSAAEGPVSITQLTTIFPGEVAIERAFAVFAGQLVECDSDDPPLDSVVIALGVRTPVGPSDYCYRETAFAIPETPDFQVAAFARHYRHPAILRSIVTRGTRVSVPDALVGVARAVLPYTNDEGVDRGAILCSLAYQALEAPADKAAVAELLRAIGDWLAQQPEPPVGHRLRWTVSLLAATWKLQQRLGRFDDAIVSAERCAALDTTSFSPLLAARTLEAILVIATHRLARGDRSGAIEVLARAAPMARAAVEADWLNVVGDPERPLVFGCLELAQVLEIASRCLVLRDGLQRFAREAGLAWQRSVALGGSGERPPVAVVPAAPIPAGALSALAALRTQVGAGYRLAYEALQARQAQESAAHRRQEMLEEERDEQRSAVEHLERLAASERTRREAAERIAAEAAAQVRAMQRAAERASVELRAGAAAARQAEEQAEVARAVAERARELSRLSREDADRARRYAATLFDELHVVRSAKPASDAILGRR